MNRIFITLIVLIMTSTVLTAQNKKGETELVDAVEQLRKAMVDGNRSELERLAAQELSYGHSSGYVEDKEEFVEKIVRGKSDFVTIDLSNQKITLVGNTAVVRHDLSASTNDNGNPGHVNLHVLSIWQKLDGKWKMIARQAVKKQA